MITGKTRSGEIVGTWKTYNAFYGWLMCSDWGVYDYGTSLSNFQKNGGIVILDSIDENYLRKLNIINDK